LTGTALAAPAALTSSSASSVHDGILPSCAIHLPEPAPPPPGAARHGKGVTLQAAPDPCLDNFPQVSRHEGDYPDAIGNDHSVEGAGNRAAHQRADSQLREAQRLLNRKIPGEDLLFFPDDPPRVDPDKQDLPGVVEDRRDSIVPAGKRCIHAKPHALF
jgi:hypothetical protein